MLKQNLPQSFGAIVATVSATICVPVAAVAAPAEAFNYARVDVFHDGLPNAPADSFNEAYSASSPVLAEDGDASAGAFYGKARAEFGSTGFYALTGSAGLSVWSDGFTVIGDSGVGAMQVSVTIDGAVTGSQPDMSYTLFVSANPFDVQTILDAVSANDQQPSIAGAKAVLHTEVFNGVGATNLTLSGTFAYTYGQKFYLASVFGGDVAAACSAATCGSEDFFHSAKFGISAPVGSGLITVSQTGYAAAVPEPETWAMLIAGLAVTGWASRRARK